MIANLRWLRLPSLRSIIFYVYNGLVTRLLCLLQEFSHIAYSWQPGAMSNHMIADLFLFSISLASKAGLLVDALLHQRLRELPVYGILLLLDVGLIALETQLASGKGGWETQWIPSSTLTTPRGMETCDGIPNLDWSLTDRTSHMRGAYQLAVGLRHMALTSTSL